ncbi:alpha/beta hydrolase [Pelagicoccus sp. NFK12]|uniref:Alpha/beta hydrolase n=1 Tax=Pelagicoccus enzymogenes TaxID=2773457 RepID=A0A927F6U9_9BACT|nr:alpha/beta hydrolase [Pelagicoccus enzymogenes]MBD5778053.1 alpha/beta hydrolase [Pelagicoccus enzymogenes]
MRYLIIGLLLFASTILKAGAPPIPGDWTSGYAYVNGIRVHYYRAVPETEKPVIVMVHGVTDNGVCWSTLTWKLQKDYDIYMLDTRGHGLSDPFTPNDDGDTLIKDVVEFVRVMDIEKPILMGHSMGAATVMRIGAEYPDLARAVVMLDPFVGRRGPPPGSRDDDGKAPARRPGPPAREPNPETLSFSMHNSPEYLVAQNNYSYDALVAKARRDNPRWNLVDCQYWALSKKQYHGAYSDQAWQSMSGSMRTEDALATISVPALILKADASPEQRQAHQEAAKVMQNGKLVHIDDSGHNLHHDQLLRTTEVIVDFFSQLKD